MTVVRLGLRTLEVFPLNGHVGDSISRGRCRCSIVSHSMVFRHNCAHTSPHQSDLLCPREIAAGWPQQKQHCSLKHHLVENAKFMYNQSAQARTRNLFAEMTDLSTSVATILRRGAYASTPEIHIKNDARRDAWQRYKDAACDIASKDPALRDAILNIPNPADARHMKRFFAIA